MVLAAKKYRVPAKRRETDHSGGFPPDGGSDPGDTRLLPLEEVDPSDLGFQFRITVKVEDVKSSFLREGQLEPIDVLGPRPFRIIDGFRRYDAAKQLGWPSIRAFVHDVSEHNAHKLAFVKNVVRKNLAPMERANAVRKARQQGRTSKEIASDFGISEKQLSRYDDLLTFSSEIQRHLAANDITMAHAKVLEDAGVKFVDPWLARIKKNEWSADRLRRELRTCLGLKRSGRPKQFLKRMDDGFRMYPFMLRRDSPKREVETAATALREALELLNTWN